MDIKEIWKIRSHQDINYLKKRTYKEVHKCNYATKSLFDINLMVFIELENIIYRRHFIRKRSLE